MSSLPPKKKTGKKWAQRKPRSTPDAGMNIGSSCPTTSIPASADKSPQALSELAQNLSLDTGLYVDTRFFVFSRRRQNGTLFAPRAVYANSWILRAKLSSYFEPLLRGGFDRGSVTGPLHSPIPKELIEESNSYDYDSDSDLDDDEDGQDIGTSVVSSALEKKGDSGKTDTDRGRLGIEALTPALGVGKTLLMRNCAYTTWKALIFYIYTGKIIFAPLISQQSCQDTETRPGRLDTSPTCSPKSMYRLADQLGFEELKRKAFIDIKSKLSPSNILEELFSTTTFRYTEIRDMEITYAYDNARATVNANVMGIIDTMDADDLRRSTAVISCLLTKFSSPLPPPPKQTTRIICSSAYGCDASYHTCRSCGNALIATISS